MYNKREDIFLQYSFENGYSMNDLDPKPKEAVYCSKSNPCVLSKYSVDTK